MPNPKRGLVSTNVELSGLSLVVKFGNNEIAELEEALGLAVHQIFDQIDDIAPSRRFIRAALYAGISHDKRFSRGPKRRQVTLDKIGVLLDQLDSDEMAALLKDILRALFGAFGIDTDELLADAPEDPTQADAASSSAAATGAASAQ